MIIYWETVPEQQTPVLLSVPRSIEHLERKKEEIKIKGRKMHPENDMAVYSDFNFSNDHGFLHISALSFGRFV